MFLTSFLVNKIIVLIAMTPAMEYSAAELLWTAPTSVWRSVIKLQYSSKREFIDTREGEFGWENLFYQVVWINFPSRELLLWSSAVVHISWLFPRGSSSQMIDIFYGYTMATIMSIWVELNVDMMNEFQGTKILGIGLGFQISQAIGVLAFDVLPKLYKGTWREVSFTQAVGPFFIWAITTKGMKNLCEH